MKPELEIAYSPVAFRQMGHELIDLLADHLEGLSEQKVIDYQEPEQVYGLFKKELEQSESNDLSWLDTVLKYSVQVPNPRYMGHQISPPVPITALMGLVDGLINNGMGVYEMGQAGTAIERVVVKTVAQQLGFGEGSDGILTSGGTLANLTALLAARSSTNVWQDGYEGPLALMVSEEAHYCVDRAARIMGWGSDGIIKIPTDSNYRMDTTQLESALQAAKKAGRKVVAVVGSACNTSTGAFDDLDDIADFCEKHQLWFHVDGAHGAALSFSTQHRKVLKGIERADSVVMDFHKMLINPAVTTALIYKKGQDSYCTFQQKAQYLWEREEATEWHNLAKRTFECTKLMMGLKVYSLLRTYGPGLWEEYLNRVMENGQEMARQVKALPNFELPLQPQCNIVCFRYKQKGMDEQTLNRLNAAIRQRSLQDGTFYIVQTNLKGTLYLRVTLTNPFTTATHLTQLLQSLDGFAKDILME
ncbi:MAG: aminotransferase class V-fold PLP-dependent enzyme [Chitinophagales bacterium]|nr:aminotransferase class V-fold PLP-dependent enzyme [Chitinophagales bacterium]